MKDIKRVIRSLKNILRDEQILGIIFAAIFWIRDNASYYSDRYSKEKMTDALAEALIESRGFFPHSERNYTVINRLYEDLQLPGNKEVLRNSDVFKEFVSLIISYSKEYGIKNTLNISIQNLANTLPFLKPYTISDTLAQIMTELCGDLNGKRIMYPFCGCGGILPYLTGSRSTKIDLYEQNRTYSALARAYAALCNDSEINQFDTSLPDGESDRNIYDIAIGILPFDITPMPKDFKKEMNWYFNTDERYSSAPQIWRICEALDCDGRAVLIVPNGVLFRGGNDLRLREMLIYNNWLSSVVYLPPRILKHTSVACSILVIQKSRKEEYIRFVDAIGYEDKISGGRQAFFSPRYAFFISELIKNRDEQDSHCINAIPDGELRLDRQFYFGNAKEAEEEIAAQQLKNEVNEAYGKYISAHNELMSLIDKTK